MLPPMGDTDPPLPRQPTGHHSGYTAEVFSCHSLHPRKPRLTPPWTPTTHASQTLTPPQLHLGSSDSSSNPSVTAAPGNSILFPPELSALGFTLSLIPLDGLEVGQVGPQWYGEGWWSGWQVCRPLTTPASMSSSSGMSATSLLMRGMAETLQGSLEAASSQGDGPTA
jgi:hypothetical protein